MKDQIEKANRHFKNLADKFTKLVCEIAAIALMAYGLLRLLDVLNEVIKIGLVALVVYLLVWVIFIRRV